MLFRYRTVEGEDIYCCRNCKYISEDLFRCEKLNKSFGSSDGCPPNWCPFPMVELKESKT